MRARLARLATRSEPWWHTVTVLLFAAALVIVVILFPGVSNLWVSVFVLVGSFTAAVTAAIGSLKAGHPDAATEALIQREGEANVLADTLARMGFRPEAGEGEQGSWAIRQWAQGRLGDDGHPPCCDSCEGTGGTYTGPCWDCRGTGHPHS